jgi:hypothetical protein
MLTPEKYEALKAKLLDAGPDDYSLEAQERAFAAIDEYEAAQQTKEQADTERAQQLMQQLDPSMPIVPQVLATQGGTTHPSGDQEAESEWLRGSLDNPAGRVVVYETPTAKVREMLMADPQLGKTLTDGRGLTPEEIAAIQPGDSLHQAVNDELWKRHSDAAVAGGKTAYRYSKAPYLQGGPNASWLDTLSTKLGSMPLDSMAAVVMGYDDVANFGAIGAAAGADPYAGINAEMAAERAAKGIEDPQPTVEGARPSPLNPKNERVGGIQAEDAKTRQDMVAEEHPYLHAGGQLLGALHPRGASSKLFDMTLGKVAKSVAGEGAGLGKRALAGALGMGAAGSAEQAAREGVDAATGGNATLGEAAGRVAEGGADALMFGGPFAAFQGLAKAGGEWVRGGKRYKGLPGQAEKLNEGKVEFGRGHIDPPDVKAARAEGKSRKMEVGPVDVLAEKLDEPIRQAGSELVGKVEKAGAANAAAHYASKEGKVTLQQENTVRASLERMRKLTSEVAGDRLTPVGKAGADNPLKGIFNAAIENVTTRPSKSGVPLSLKEAKAFLSPEWQKKAKLDVLEKRGAAKVYVTPRRLDSKRADEAIAQLSDSADEDVKAVLEAAKRDRDGRAWSGAKGAWSKVQEQQAKGAAKAKEVQELAGGDKPRGAYEAVVEASTPHKGESLKLQALGELAKRSDAARPKPYGPQPTGPGPTEKLFDSARAAGVMDELRGWSSLGKNPSGLERGRTMQVLDAGTLRLAYPISRKVEKAGDARKLGKLGAVNNDDAEREERTKKREEPAKQAAKERAAKAESEPKKGKRRKRPSWEWMREEMNQ